jgi:hypothetical protein
MSDLDHVRGSVIFAEENAQLELCEQFDKIKARHALTDQEILTAVQQWCSFDTYDAYVNWIAESEE